MKKIDVLDKGHIILQDHMGNDLSIVNAARASFNKKSAEFDENDKRLLKFLYKNGHMSPFRHATLTFEIKAPLMVRSQWGKYTVGCDHSAPEYHLVLDGTGNGDEARFGDPIYARNESSRRYVSNDIVFYIPNSYEWRSAPENKKQGSGEPISKQVGEKYTNWLIEDTKRGLERFNEALEDGIAPEQARLFLHGYSLYANWYWTASLQSVLFFLNQRLNYDAQKEIQEYAKAVYELMQDIYPETMALIYK